MRAPREIELKLECGVQDLTALSGHPLLKPADAAAGPAAPVLMESTYFDTAGGDLRAAKLSLRLRREDGRTVQTLKAASASAGLFDRPEWEWEVAGPEPDTGLLADTPAAGVLARASEPELRPLYKTVVERTTRPVRHGASDISVTLDAGRVETDKGDAPLCEVELELKDGDPADLFALAREIGRSVPLRLGALSKGERGLTLIEDRLRRPSKAQVPEFGEGVTAGEAFVRIAQGCLRQFRLNEAVFLHGRDPEALHQMRVSLRRLRSAFTLFKPMLRDDETARDLSRQIKSASEPFGTARNLDVFLSETLPREIERRPDEPGLTELRERLCADRERAYAQVLDTLESQAWRMLLIDLVAWIEAGSWRGDARVPHRDRAAADFAGEVLERLRGRIRKRGRKLAKLSPEARHEVRIEAKKLRYGAEFFGPLFPEKPMRRRHKAFVSALSDLQDHLGALNDLATAHEIAAGLMAPDTEPASGAALFAAGLTAADGEGHAKALLAQAADAREALLDVKRFWR